MAIRVRVKNGKQVICPLRFERAVTGAPVADAPDVDERGFEMGTRPGTWGRENMRGAMVSITEGDTIRVKVNREDIDSTAPLYAVSTDTGVIEVVQPAGGGPIPGSGVFQIRGVRDFANRNVKVELRLGAANGPVLGELEPHIFKMGDTRELRVCIHFVTIRGVRTVRTAPSMTSVIDQVNRIWRPCGISFRYDATNASYAREDTANNLLPAYGGAQFAVPGTVTTHLSATPSTWREFSTVINTNHRANFINIYCVQQAPEWIGLTYSNANARPNGYGIAIDDRATAHNLAHELGHMLHIDNHSDEDGTGTRVRDDIWARGCLMYSFSGLNGGTGPAHRLDVGHGAGIPGALITVKDLGSDPRDGELALTRRHALNSY